MHVPPQQQKKKKKKENSPIWRVYSEHFRVTELGKICQLLKSFEQFKNHDKIDLKNFKTLNSIFKFCNQLIEF